jgi:selenocysteine lyase/cysteine desulfurase
MDRLTVAEAQGLWAPETIYLNTASYGLPPQPGWEALQAALGDWRAGRTSWEQWGDATEAARATWARLVGVPAADVATGSTVSALVGLVAAQVPDGTRVLAPHGEFASAIFPFMVQAGRGVEVEFVPLDRLAEAIDGRTGVVTFSAVQSAGGEVADLDAIATAAAHHGALTVVDATQACGWLPLDATRFDAVACAGYKWLLGPRGTAFLALRPSLAERLVPLAAGWYAAADPHASYYGPPLQLGPGAKRFDISPAWFSWVGAAPALELLERIGIAAIRDHDVALANRFRAGLGLEPSDSAIVSAELPGVEERLAGSRVMAAARAGRLRTSWHVYNTEADVDAALEVLGAR